ncbi:MAG: cation transporter [Oscillospiraceae bacterium]|nr:cation transporter [Oscillospiraceae bacterium]
MQKKFKIEVDCANCAAKIEQAISKLPGVNNVSVSFMAQKMVLDAEDERFDEVLQASVKAAKRVEPDFEIEL